TTKIRGVNLGSQFIVEPWMAAQEWIDMGCYGAKAEFQCIKDNYGGDVAAASVVWQEHWRTWITHSDIKTMARYGLNTIRIPVGWWMREDLVQSGEYFPKGGFAYLKKICNWAAEAGFYIIIDLHAVPGTQDADQPFTGNYSDTAYFYQSDYQSERAYDFLGWITAYIHTSNAFRNVGALEIINEPKYNTIDGDTKWMVEHYYGSAITVIRSVEAVLGVAPSARLHITLMDDLWGSGSDDPTSSLSAEQKEFLLFDDHNYEPVSSDNQTEILKYACADERTTTLEPGNTKIVGEWSMNLNGAWEPEQNYSSFYQQWFAAQQEKYEETNGWVYWTWKTNQLDLTNW
ncbi:glycoside hydrolase family 5 protein, partial [Saccharata proteae CBS 121410]